MSSVGIYPIPIYRDGVYARKVLGSSWDEGIDFAESLGIMGDGYRVMGVR